eukprot:CAMPEP_0196575092 /NCGR_PEP_ID=MMETSP1081-20130531/4659_1 /TAXON_ID=36882 /ORGANISM="Pyramimonas amylifera, Strain CCMP720" /LENGTH=94 /DNA_ID=CAMNT_0041893293 /DNA_START=50 /DNA_END=334 /DNA_ORIENTATION=-
MAANACTFFGSRLSQSLVAPAKSCASGPKQVTTCMAKKKGIRVVITIECTEARKEGLTPSRYTTQKNRKNTPDKLEIMKYNKFLRRRTIHREIK